MAAQSRINERSPDLIRRGRRRWLAAMAMLICVLVAGSIAARAEPAADNSTFSSRFAAADGHAEPNQADTPPASHTEPPPKADLPASSSYPDARARYRAIAEKEATAAG